MIFFLQFAQASQFTSLSGITDPQGQYTYANDTSILELCRHQMEKKMQSEGSQGDALTLE